MILKEFDTSARRGCGVRGPEAGDHQEGRARHAHTLRPGGTRYTNNDILIYEYTRDIYEYTRDIFHYYKNHLKVYYLSSSCDGEEYGDKRRGNTMIKR